MTVKDEVYEIVNRKSGNIFEIEQHLDQHILMYSLLLQDETMHNVIKSIYENEFYRTQALKTEFQIARVEYKRLNPTVLFCFICENNPKFNDLKHLKAHNKLFHFKKL